MYVQLLYYEVRCPLHMQAVTNLHMYPDLLFRNGSPLLDECSWAGKCHDMLLIQKVLHYCLSSTKSDNDKWWL